MTLAPAISSVLLVEISSKDDWIEIYCFPDFLKTIKKIIQMSGMITAKAIPIFQSKMKENTRAPMMTKGALATNLTKNKTPCCT